jgi:hypothetical protein
MIKYQEVPGWSVSMNSVSPSLEFPYKRWGLSLAFTLVVSLLLAHYLPYHTMPPTNAASSTTSSSLYSFTFKIHGKVQGVYFRKYTKLKGVELGLRGYVQNDPDGSVTGVAQGLFPSLQTL